MSDILASTKERMSKQHNIRECHKFLRFFAVPSAVYDIYEIMSRFKMSKNRVKIVLNVLLRFALIYNYFTENSFDDDFRRYELSKLGKAYTERFNVKVKGGEKEDE